MKGKTLFAVGALMLLKSSHAAVQFYAADLRNDLYLLDIYTGVVSNIGAIATVGGGHIQSLALSPTGELYAGDDRGWIYELNPTNASVLRQAPTQMNGLMGMDFDGATAIATDGSANSMQAAMDLSISGFGQIIPLSVANNINGIAHSLAFYSPGQAYTANQGSVAKSVWDLDVNSGATSFGFMDTAPDFFRALDYGSDGKLYGLHMSGKHILIDTTLQTTTMIYNSGLQDWTAMTAVPEPATMAAIGLGVVAMLRRRRR
ncbi:MAG: hypothetical protein HONBIEJF_01824 [Fimbriimonadaceae bacterium]|nr:hypothetical protein [Fimbriimonadaceae bacterium]